MIGEVLKAVSQMDHVKRYIDTNWQGSFKAGIAWRRYDRLQWIVDLHESQIQVSWCMFDTHDLELRLKVSYSRPVHFEETNDKMDEPTPVEGFVERLTTWTGGPRKQNINRRTYLHSHDNLLFYSLTDKLLPPVYADITREDIMHKDADTLLQGKRHFYEVLPFKLVAGPDGEDIEWIAHSKTLEDIDIGDRQAFYEWERRTANILLLWDLWI
jgi:hypothetical protein